MIKKTDSYLSLLAINKKLTEQHDKDNLEISELKLKCDEIQADFALINSGYLCNNFPYEKRGAICVLQDKTIVHASILLEEDWEHQIEILKASI